MAIEKRDWENNILWAGGALKEPPVEYRMVEQSAAWAQLRTWLRTQIEVKMKESAALIAAVQRSGDYSHESLIRQKVLIDISQAQVLTLAEIEAKVLAYSKEADA